MTKRGALHGASLLGVLVTLAIAMPVLFVGGEAVRGAYRAALAVAKYEHRQRILALTESLCDRLIDSVDSQPLEIIPGAFPNGVIVGRYGPIRLAAAPRLQPQPGSDAVGWIAAHGDELLLPERVRLAGGAVEMRLCSAFGSGWSPSEHRLLIGLFTDSLAEVRHTRCRRSTQGCHDCIIGEAAEGLIGDTRRPPRSALNGAIPVREARIVYVDQSHTLRFVQYDGRRVIENQPIERGVAAISAEIITRPDGLVDVNLTVVTRGGFKAQCHRVSRIARDTVLQLLGARLW